MSLIARRLHGPGVGGKRAGGTRRRSSGRSCSLPLGEGLRRGCAVSAVSMSRVTEELLTGADPAPRTSYDRSGGRVRRVKAWFFMLCGGWRGEQCGPPRPWNETSARRRRMPCPAVRRSAVHVFCTGSVAPPGCAARLSPAARATAMLRVADAGDAWSMDPHLLDEVLN